jgi:hypothetical protein
MGIEPVYGRPPFPRALPGTHEERSYPGLDEIPVIVPRSDLAWSPMLRAVALGFVLWLLVGVLALVVLR